MKWMVYPASRYASVLARYPEEIPECEEIRFVTPEGWGADGEDFSSLDGGLPTGVALSTDFESGLEQADAVLFADGPIPLPEKFLLGKIARALEAKKQVVLEKIPEELAGKLPLDRVSVLKEDDPVAVRKPQMQDPEIYTVPVPVVFVLGTGPHTNKLEVQTALGKYFREQGYSVSQVASRNLGNFLEYLNDVKDKDSITIDGSVQNALRNAKEDDCICFFDDGAYSGKQVISIFQEFMGVPEMERTTNEHHVDELTAEQKDKLKQTKIVLAYLCFNPQSEKYIKSEFLKIGLTDITICYTHDLSRKIFDMLQPYFTTSEQQQIVKKHLQQIGCSILMSTKKLENGEFKPRWDEKRVTDAALGYNDAQQFVVFSTNIPTYSITPFWANGRLGDREWVGLFQRTNKD